MHSPGSLKGSEKQGNASLDEGSPRRHSRLLQLYSSDFFICSQGPATEVVRVQLICPSTQLLCPALQHQGGRLLSKLQVGMSLQRVIQDQGQAGVQMLGKDSGGHIRSIHRPVFSPLVALARLFWVTEGTEKVLVSRQQRLKGWRKKSFNELSAFSTSPADSCFSVRLWRVLQVQGWEVFL